MRLRDDEARFDLSIVDRQDPGALGLVREGTMTTSSDSADKLVAGRLDGQVAIVTGAGQGIGRACALHLGRLGAKVIVNSRLSAGQEPGDVAGGVWDRLKGAPGRPQPGAMPALVAFMEGVS